MILALAIATASPIAATPRLSVSGEFCLRLKSDTDDAKRYRSICEILAEERAFAALAAEKGQWTAFRATAAPDSAMFVPKKVDAPQWLAGRADPQVSVRWQPHRVFASCDGTTGVTWRAAQWPDGSHGRFMTIWQRQADGGWKWVLDVGGLVGAPLIAPREPDLLVANCERGNPPQRDPIPVEKGGSSPDQSLSWFVAVDPQGKGNISIHGWNGRWFQQLSSDTMPIGTKP